jgi:hypothetical protein
MFSKAQQPATVMFGPLPEWKETKENIAELFT